LVPETVQKLVQDSAGESASKLVPALAVPMVCWWAQRMARALAEELVRPLGGAMALEMARGLVLESALTLVKARAATWAEQWGRLKVWGLAMRWARGMAP